MIVCEVCGHDFLPKVENHYISRDNGKIGLIASFQSNQEEKIYDTFDCPKCGCQCVAQERKRNFYSGSTAEVDAHEEVDGDGEKA